MTTTVNVTAAAISLLKEAQDASSGRAGRTLQREAHASLKQTLLALRASQSLGDHTAPGPASVMVVQGSVVLSTAESDLDLGAGDWAPIPRTAHSLRAHSDAVVLLTVAALEPSPQ